MGLDEVPKRTAIMKRMGEYVTRVEDEEEKPKEGKGKEREALPTEPTKKEERQPQKKVNKPSADPLFAAPQSVEGPYGRNDTPVPVRGVDESKPRIPPLERIAEYPPQVEGRVEGEPKSNNGKGPQKAVNEPPKMASPIGPSGNRIFEDFPPRKSPDIDKSPIFPDIAISYPRSPRADYSLGTPSRGKKDEHREGKKVGLKDATPEKPQPKLNPMFENYPPRNDGALIDGAILSPILRAPVMGRDDATVSPRSPRLPFYLGPPIRGQKEEPKVEPKDDKSTEKPEKAPPSDQPKTQPTTRQASPTRSPEVATRRDYARKHPGRDCVTLANAAITSIEKSQTAFVDNMLSQRIAIGDCELAIKGLKNEYEKKIRDLEKKHEKELEDANSNDGLDKCKKENRELRSKLKECEKKESKVEELEGQVENLKEALMAAPDSGGGLVKKAVYELEKERLERKLDEANEQLDLLKSDYNSGVERYNNEKEKHDKLKNSLEWTQNELRKAEDNIYDLEEDVDAARRDSSPPKTSEV